MTAESSAVLSAPTDPKCCNSFSAVLVPIPGISVSSVPTKFLLL